MKKSLFSQLILGLSLVALPILGGCTQQNADISTPFVGTANAEPISSETNLALFAPALTNFPVAETGDANNVPMETNAAMTAAMAMPPAAPVAELIPPSDVRLTPALTEVVKLVQSGVEQPVLLTFITNTTGYFSLGAEEIVYLNDLGVAGNVMTAMMQHDQELRETRMNAVQEQMNTPVQVAQPAEPEIAAAPSYVDHPAVEAQPVEVSTTYFNDTLAPYGSWVFVSGLGRCWRPTVAIGNPGWRPYCDRGRWVFTNCGWFWLSDYSWGATTFHYGRWFSDPRWGWCWWPNTVWAPSWVCWRSTSGFCGWAPLPPTACFRPGFGLMFQNGPVGVNCGFGLGANVFVFVPWGNFCSPRPWQHCLPSSRANQVFHASTPVNHLEAGGRGEVNNRGIAPEVVRQHTGTEVRTATIREQASYGLRAENLERDGRTLAVHRPQFVASADGTGSVTAPSGRPAAPRGNAATISGTSVQSSPLSSTRTGRAAVTTTPSAVATESPSRVETRPFGQRTPATVNRAANSTRPVAPIAARTPKVALPTVAPSSPTRTVESPRMTEVITPTTPRPTAGSSSVVVIGRGNSPRSSGRDYSVWSTPGTTPDVPLGSPRGNASTRYNPSPVVGSPQIAENFPQPAPRAQMDRGRPEVRSPYSTYSIPQRGQVIAPSMRSAPTAVPSSPRMEARPTPSAPAAAPGGARPAYSPGRPGR